MIYFMILTDKVILKVNINNIQNLKNNGYDNINLGDEIEVYVIHLSKGSHCKITVKCDVCGKVRENLMYKEYMRNIKSGGYYSCKGKCSSDKNRKTCIDRYGVDNPSRLDYFKNKKIETSLNNYGVEYFFQTGEVKKHFLEKYGVDNPSKLESVKENRKRTMNDRHGVDYYVLHENFQDKAKSTFISNWGVDHPMKNNTEVKKRLNKRGLCLETDGFKKYRNRVDLFTKKNKQQLFESWDGFDYYDGEYIFDNFNLSGQHGDYPTIDHKVSVYDGFRNNIPAEDLAKLENLCVTKRRINSKKYNKSNFIL